MKKLRYVGYLMINGDICRLPNCMHFCLSNSLTIILSSLRANVFKLFSFDFIMDNRIEVLVRDLKSDSEEIYDFSVFD